MTRVRGDTKPWRFLILDAEGVEQNLENFSFTLNINAKRTPLDDEHLLASISGTGDQEGNLAIEPTANQVDFVGIKYYDIKMSDPNDVVYTLYKGQVEFLHNMSGS